MTEQIQRKLSESKTARWSVLALVAFTMLCGYFITDMMAPLQDLLQTPVEGGGLGWTANEYGKFTSAYGWFNVFFMMLVAIKPVKRTPILSRIIPPKISIRKNTLNQP